jgi:hypothetical protein
VFSPLLATLCAGLPPALAPGAAAAQDLWLELAGDGAVASAGDVDGDGRADVLIGDRSLARARVYSGATGLVLLELLPTVADDRFGAAVAGGLDVNGDGVPDLVVGGGGEVEGLPELGSAEVFSGASGASLWRTQGQVLYEQRGRSVALVRDTDGDGRAEVLVGAPGRSTLHHRAGGALLFDGQTGQVLRQWFGAGTADQLGFAVAGLDDVNLDGRGDVVLGAIEDYPGPGGAQAHGRVEVKSGANGAALYQRPGPTNVRRFGSALAGGGDLDGDVRDDWLVAAASLDPADLNRGYVAGHAGLDGQELRSQFGPALGDHFGAAVAFAPDFDGDGRDDWMVGASQGSGTPLAPSFGPGAVRLLRGADGQLLLEVTGAAHSSLFGTSVAWLGDSSGDGQGEFAAGAPGTAPAAPRVHSSVPLVLAADSHLLPLGAGGQHLLSIDAGAAGVAPGGLAIVLGSATGTAPGSSIDGVAVPLVVDAWTWLSVVSANQPPYAGTFAFTGAGGLHDASLTAPPSSPPALAGLTLHHVVLLASPVTFGIVAAGGPVAVTLVP